MWLSPSSFGLGCQFETFLKLSVLNGVRDLKMLACVHGGTLMSKSLGLPDRSHRHVTSLIAQHANYRQLAVSRLAAHLTCLKQQGKARWVHEATRDANLPSAQRQSLPH